MSIKDFRITFHPNADPGKRAKIEQKLLRLALGKDKLKATWRSYVNDRYDCVERPVEKLKRSHGEEPEEGESGKLKWRCGCITEPLWLSASYPRGERVYACSELHREIYDAVAKF